MFFRLRAMLQVRGSVAWRIGNGEWLEANSHQTNCGTLTFSRPAMGLRTFVIRYLPFATKNPRQLPAGESSDPSRFGRDQKLR
jgi:hypothetical protein